MWRSSVIQFCTQNNNDTYKTLGRLQSHGRQPIAYLRGRAMGCFVNYLENMWLRDIESAPCITPDSYIIASHMCIVIRLHSRISAFWKRGYYCRYVYIRNVTLITPMFQMFKLIFSALSVNKTPFQPYERLMHGIKIANLLMIHTWVG